ncbi:hypothetical protein EXU48_15810 [Occultella glacieicola]|uniref:Uncharacterized protein n=1 Tax=Occultella glacieicola TaxID=2518684 RepID=A0ABY2E4C7_9MICO|nr:hypothetical protein [Occultella glacieicola]TDE91608.1 hypothetical protein EXU48_15810 [Occultella glacieicola]
MASVEVVPADLAAAATRLEEARDGVASLRTDADLAAVAAALKGSDSARAADELAAAWRRRLRAWDTAAQRQIEAMGVTAKAYEVQDGEGAATYARLGPAPGGR